ncbi:MAG TPA: iron-sulfur cluster insertion protein ErpA [Anaerolineales bacterium]|nr:iron-sulfur cluster insertion protein ErpA [Anaerolineales bacterium]
MTTPELIETPTTETVDSPIILTAGAANKIRTLLQERNLPNHGLRVFVSGGGCSGMQYGMALEAAEREFDAVLSVDGVKLFVDPTSMMYLEGATIDYVENLMGGGFRIDNPNAVSSCGCGHSFRTAQQGESEEQSEGGSCCSH